MPEAKFLNNILTDFALTMASDIPVQGMVDELVTRICEILPIDSAGVTLRDALRPAQLLASSSDAARQMEEAQIYLHEGPSLTAFTLEVPVSVPDISRESTYPRLARSMRRVGLQAMFAFPLRYGSTCLGSLSLYNDAPISFTPAEREAAQTLVDVTAAYLFNARSKIEVALDSSRFELNATHDALTGLPNRSFLMSRDRMAADMARQKDSRTAALFLDIDRFKIVNDTHGHAVGDELLVEIAKRLSRTLRRNDTLVRISGDEFVVWCTMVEADDNVQRLATRILKAFSVPFVLRSHVLEVTVSVGIAISTVGIETDQGLIEKADKAMYRAKRLGGGTYHVFDDHMDDDKRAQTLLKMDLTAAINSDQIALTYEPIIRNEDNVMTGVEALVRWTHPTLGDIDKLSAIAEESGMIIEIGHWMLETACRARAEWAAAKPDQALSITINVSAKQLMEQDFADRASAIMARRGTPPAAVIVEVTESAAFDSGLVPQENLARLQRIGVRVSLDNFGTGFSTLTHLRTFTVDNVKIQQNFISDIANDRVAAIIVSSITALAKSLGIAVTAEGLETESQHAHVIEAGVDFSQGPLFGRAMSADAILELL